MGDTYIAYRLLKETIRRVVGIPTDASLLTTMVALGVSVSVLRRLAAPVLRASRPEAPSFATTMMAAAVVSGDTRRHRGRPGSQHALRRHHDHDQHGGADTPRHRCFRPRRPGCSLGPRTSVVVAEGGPSRDPRRLGGVPTSVCTSLTVNRRQPAVTDCAQQRARKRERPVNTGRSLLRDRDSNPKFDIQSVACCQLHHPGPSGPRIVDGARRVPACAAPRGAPASRARGRLERGGVPARARRRP